MNKTIKPEIVFLHIPKTAGSTFNSILNDQYPIISQKRLYSHDQTLRYIEKSSRLKRIIKGHFKFSILEDIPGYTYCLTFLRHPVDRLISAYEFVFQYKHHPMHEKAKKNKYTLLDFLEMKITNADNTMTRFLMGESIVKHGELSEAHFELASKNLLSDKMLIGITERFDESILYFKHILQWENPFYYKQNITKNKFVNLNEMDSKTLEALKSHTAYDIRLYELALDKFNTQLQTLNDRENQLTAFRKANHFSWNQKMLKRFKSKAAVLLQ